MADIFISYAHSDKGFTEVLGREIEKLGWTVTWEHKVPGSWTDSDRTREIEAARAVIVLWSRRSIENAAVLAEARNSAARGKLFPILIAPVEPPAEFARARLLSLDTVISEGERSASLEFGRHPVPDPKRLAASEGFLEIKLELKVRLGMPTVLKRRAVVGAAMLLLAVVAAGGAWWVWSRRSDSTARALAGQSIPQQLLDARKPNLTLPRFLKPARDDDAPSQADATLLLFVHGIFGDTVGTWSRGSVEEGLPYRILARREFAHGFDAFAFGYPTSTIKAGSFSIPEAAKALATEINFRSFTAKYKQIVIVAHSMGGLVALETLTTFPDIRARVPLVVTFGTPYDGAQLAELGQRVLDNPALTDMIQREVGNSLLSSLAGRWKAAKTTGGATTTVICAYEKVPLPGIGLVVAETSASALCDLGADAIAEDHIGIIKPDGPEHQSIKVLTNALRTVKKAASVMDGRSSETPKFATLDLSTKDTFRITLQNGKIFELRTGSLTGTKADVLVRFVDNRGAGRDSQLDADLRKQAGSSFDDQLQRAILSLPGTRVSTGMAFGFALAGGPLDQSVCNTVMPTGLDDPDLARRVARAYEACLSLAMTGPALSVALPASPLEGDVPITLTNALVSQLLIESRLTRAFLVVPAGNSTMFDRYAEALRKRIAGAS